MRLPSAALAEKIADHQPRRCFGRVDHAGNPGPRVGACAREVETADLLVPVVDPEPRALGQDRFERESRAEVRVEVVLEVIGGDDPHCLDVGLEIGQIALLEVSEDFVSIARALLTPVDRRVAEVGDRRQDIEGLAALRRDRRIGQGRGVEVEGEMVR